MQINSDLNANEVDSYQLCFFDEEDRIVVPSAAAVDKRMNSLFQIEMIMR